MSRHEVTTIERIVEGERTRLHAEWQLMGINKHHMHNPDPNHPYHSSRYGAMDRRMADDVLRVIAEEKDKEEKTIPDWAMSLAVLFFIFKTEGHLEGKNAEKQMPQLAIFNHYARQCYDHPDRAGMAEEEKIQHGESKINLKNLMRLREYVNEQRTLLFTGKVSGPRLFKDIQARVDGMKLQ